eukprot:326069-Chlamydomonas_euryale.AAC.1
MPQKGPVFHTKIHDCGIAPHACCSFLTLLLRMLCIGYPRFFGICTALGPAHDGGGRRQRAAHMPRCAASILRHPPVCGAASEGSSASV